jgi:hypothetical protein
MHQMMKKRKRIYFGGSVGAMGLYWMMSDARNGVHHGHIFCLHSSYIITTISKIETSWLQLQFAHSRISHLLE